MAIVGKSSSVAKGNIIVDPTVGGGVGPNLEGIYVADSAFKTGGVTVGDDIPLYIRGSVVGYEGVTLQRDLGDVQNGVSPAELLEYAPDQIMLFPSKLGFRKINWKEVAP